MYLKIDENGREKKGEIYFFWGKNYTGRKLKL